MGSAAHTQHASKSAPGDAVTFLEELYAVCTLADDHDTEYDGGHYITPSLIDHDDGKENDGRAAD